MSISENDWKMLFILGGILIFFTIILPMIDTNEPFVKDFQDYEKIINTSPINSYNDNKIDQNECSFDCCKHIQYLPDELKKNKESKYNNFIPSNLSCYGGCACIKKDNFEYLSHRGGNI